MFSFQWHGSQIPKNSFFVTILHISIERTLMLNWHINGKKKNDQTPQETTIFEDAPQRRELLKWKVVFRPHVKAVETDEGFRKR